MSKKQQHTPKPNLITASDLCDLTGLTDRRHRQLADEGKIPKPERGMYPRTATLKGLFTYYQSIQQTTSSELAQVKLEREKARTRREVLAADQAEEVLIPKEEAKRALTRYACGLRLKLLALPRRNALALSLLSEPNAVEDRLNGEVHGILTEMFKGEWGAPSCPACGKEIKSL